MGKMLQKIYKSVCCVTGDKEVVYSTDYKTKNGNPPKHNGVSNGRQPTVCMRPDPTRPLPALPAGGDMRGDPARSSRRRYHTSVTGSTSSGGFVHYSSSSLQDPPPTWTAYNPQRGVSWAPRRVVRRQPGSPYASNRRLYRPRSLSTSSVHSHKSATNRNRSSAQSLTSAGGGDSVGRVYGRSASAGSDNSMWRADLHTASLYLYGTKSTSRLGLPSTSSCSSMGARLNEDQKMYLSNSRHHHSNDKHNHSNETHNHSNDIHHYSNDIHNYSNDTHHHSNDTHQRGNDTHHYSNETHHYSNDTHHHGDQYSPYHHDPQNTSHNSKYSDLSADHSWTSFDGFQWDTSADLLHDDVIHDETMVTDTKARLDTPDISVSRRSRYDNRQLVEELLRDIHLSIDEDEQGGVESINDFTGIVDHIDPNDKDRRPLTRYLAENDLTDIIIPKNRLRTGPLVYEVERLRVCSGCLATARNKLTGPRIRPVSVHVYSGLSFEEERVSMLRQVRALRHAGDHPGLLSILGVRLDGSPATRDGLEVLLVTPKCHFFVTLNRLLCWTRENNRELLSRRVSGEFAEQICEGLIYLQKHGLSLPVLTASTIMLDCNVQAKILNVEGDHGRPLTPQYWRWLPPESLKSTHKSNQKTCVWSFGVVLWEVNILALLPYSSLASPRHLYLYLASGRRLPKPHGSSSRLYYMMCECWRTDPKFRPSFKYIQTALYHYLASLPASDTAKDMFPDREDFWSVLHDFI